MAATGCCGLNAGTSGLIAGVPVIAARRAGPLPASVKPIPGGRAAIGTDRPMFRADGEGPRREVKLRGFRIDAHATSNDDFAAFVAATDYVTDAERFGWSFVFRGRPEASAERVANAEWWMKSEGACWHRPGGTGTDLSGLGDHPVVHVSFNDAVAFGIWAGGRLPTEAEWEHAARGGLADPRYPWGDQDPDDVAFLPCNIFQGPFPDGNTAADGFAATAPVDAFAPNGYGLHNMVGNVWEWCADAFQVRSLSRAGRERNARAAEDHQRVLKGGSHLCHASYCWRYRIAARTGSSMDGGACHTGFRLVYDAQQQNQ